MTTKRVFRRRNSKRCAAGHLRTAENTNKNGECKLCVRIRSDAHRERERAVLAGLQPRRKPEKQMRVWEAEAALDRAIALESWAPNLMPWERPGWQPAEP